MIEDKEEYKALRDEMINLFTRVFVVLVAIFTAYATLSLKAIEQSDPKQMLAVLLVLSAFLVVGILLILAFYSNIYSIGSYIAVYFEGGKAHWHLRSRHMRILLANAHPNDPVPAIERINEPRTVSFAFFTMFLSLPLQFSWRFGICAQCIGFVTLVAVFLFGCWLTWSLQQAYTGGAKRWMRRWSSYKNQRGKDGEPTIDMLLSMKDLAQQVV
jgi:hypothetical protein